MSYTYSRLFFLLIKKQRAKMSKNVLFFQICQSVAFPLSGDLPTSGRLSFSEYLQAGRCWLGIHLADV